MCIKIIPTHKRFAPLEERNNSHSTRVSKTIPIHKNQLTHTKQYIPLNSGIENDTHPLKGCIHTLKSALPEPTNTGIKIIPTSMGGAIAKHRLNTFHLSTGIKNHTRKPLGAQLFTT